MAKKIKVSPISEDASYTDVVDAAEQEEVVKEPVVEEGAQPPEQPSEQPTELIALNRQRKPNLKKKLQKELVKTAGKR